MTTEIINETGDILFGCIDRKWLNAREMFGRQTYSLTVTPGVDMALMAALSICLDEKNTEK